MSWEKVMFRHKLRGVLCRQIKMLATLLGGQHNIKGEVLILQPEICIQSLRLLYAIVHSCLQTGYGESGLAGTRALQFNSHSSDANASQRTTFLSHVQLGTAV